jgi:hypothetical protein
MVDLLSDTDRAALRDVAQALREARLGSERLAARLTTEAETRAAARQQGRKDALVGAGSRVLVAIVVAVGLFAGLRASKSTPPPAPTLTNVATHSDITTSEICIRSDLAVYLDGAAPNPLCGLPPGAPTKGTK